MVEIPVAIVSHSFASSVWCRRPQKGQRHCASDDASRQDHRVDLEELRDVSVGRECQRRAVARVKRAPHRRGGGVDFGPVRRDGDLEARKAHLRQVLNVVLFDVASRVVRGAQQRDAAPGDGKGVDHRCSATSPARRSGPRWGLHSVIINGGRRAIRLRQEQSCAGPEVRASP